jgi:transcriptional regulator with XRE-family HTH domain
MRNTQCAECGGGATVSRKNYRFDQMGIPVELQKIEVIDCPNCGESPIIPNMNELMDALAMAVVCHPCTLRGAEVRFLRKYVNKSAREFAQYLHIEHTSLSKIENSQRKLSATLDKLVRLTIFGMQPKLRDELNELMELMPNIKDRCSDENAEIQIDPATGVYQYA